MQVTSAIGFSLAPTQNAEMPEQVIANTKTAVSSECGCSAGESMFTRLFFNGIAKQGAAKLQEMIPQISDDGEAAKDGETELCDISAVLAQLFISPMGLPDGSPISEEQSENIAGLGAAETEEPSMLQFGDLNLISRGVTANGSEIVPPILNTGVPKEDVGFNASADGMSAQAYNEIAGDVMETIGGTVTGETTGGQAAAVKATAGTLISGFKTLDKLTAERARDADTNSSPSSEKVTGGDLKEFVGKIAETLKSMGAEETDGETSEGFTASKKETAPIKENENLASAQYAAQNTEYKEIKEAAVVKALNRFADDLKSVERGVTEIKIVLEPESLGTLTISVARTENGITARIKSDDKEICGIISGQLQKLVTAMENNGVRVEDVDVLFGGMGQDLSFAQNSLGGNQSWTHPQYSRTAQTPEKADTADGASSIAKWRDYQGADDGVSKLIEYRI